MDANTKRLAALQKMQFVCEIIFADALAVPSIICACDAATSRSVAASRQLGKERPDTRFTCIGRHCGAQVAAKLVRRDSDRIRTRRATAFLAKQGWFRRPHRRHVGMDLRPQRRVRCTSSGTQNARRTSDNRQPHACVRTRPWARGDAKIDDLDVGAELVARSSHILLLAGLAALPLALPGGFWPQGIQCSCDRPAFN